MRNSGSTQFHRSFLVRGTRCFYNPADPVIGWQLMDRRSGILFMKMADFVIVSITRQYIMIMMDKSRGVRMVRSRAVCPSIHLSSFVSLFVLIWSCSLNGEVTCGLSLHPSLIICLVICPHLVLFSKYCKYCRRIRTPTILKLANLLPFFLYAY